MESLPGELFRQIFTDKCISYRDLKSLRLVCRCTTEHVTNLLFKHIGLSRLKIDREAFLNVAVLRFNISASPGLAHLTHIYLCIDRIAFPSDPGNLSLCLRAATNLTELTVNLEFGSSFFDSNEYPYF